jgi:hypothetical protein
MNDTPGSPKINDLPTEAAAAAERAAWWLLQKDTVGPPSDFTPDVMAAIERRLATIGVEPNHFRGCVALANRLRQGQQPVTGETSRLYTRIYYRLRWSMARPADYLGSGWNDNQKRSENTFGVYRAAFGYGITQALDNCLRSILAIEGDDELLRLEWTHFLTRLGELVDLNPDYEGQRIAESSSRASGAACPSSRTDGSRPPCNWRERQGTSRRS